MTTALKSLLGPLLAWVKSQPPARRKFIYITAAVIAFAAIVVTLTFSGDSFSLWGYRFVVPARATVIAWLIPLLSPLLALVHLNNSVLVDGETVLTQSGPAKGAAAANLLVDITPSIAAELSGHLHDIANSLQRFWTDVVPTHVSVPSDPPAAVVPTPAPAPAADATAAATAPEPATPAEAPAVSDPASAAPPQA